MPSMLIRDGESAISGLPPVVEQVRCTKDDCKTSYTLHSDDSVSVYSGRGLSTEVMRKMAATKIEETHPSHSTVNYYWKGPDLGWREADTVNQRKAL